jgi:hypothetical protein
MKRSCIMFGLIVCATFSAVSAMDNWDSRQRKIIRNLVQDAKSSLIHDYPNQDLEYIKRLERFCRYNNFQIYAYQLSKACHQGKEKQQRDMERAVLGQRGAAKVLFPEVPSSSSSSSSDHMSK